MTESNILRVLGHDNPGAMMGNLSIMRNFPILQGSIKPGVLDMQAVIMMCWPLSEVLQEPKRSCTPWYTHHAQPPD